MEEIIQIADNPLFEENRKDRHNKNAQNGWYRYDVLAIKKETSKPHQSVW